jgi:hypothetical protein
LVLSDLVLSDFELSDFELSDVELSDLEVWLPVSEPPDESGLLDAPGPRTLPTAPLTESTTPPMVSLTLPRPGIFGVVAVPSFRCRFRG